jgi:hypothetical protein
MRYVLVLMYEWLVPRCDDITRWSKLLEIRHIGNSITMHWRGFKRLAKLGWLVLCNGEHEKPIKGILELK